MPEKKHKKEIRGNWVQQSPCLKIFSKIRDGKGKQTMMALSSEQSGDQLKECLSWRAAV
jgi:hypothetical protein